MHQSHTSNFAMMMGKHAYERLCQFDLCAFLSSYFHNQAGGQANGILERDYRTEEVEAKAYEDK
jgi:hypothetical protein